MTSCTDRSGESAIESAREYGRARSQAAGTILTARFTSSEVRSTIVRESLLRSVQRRAAATLSRSATSFPSGICILQVHGDIPARLLLEVIGGVVAQPH